MGATGTSRAEPRLTWCYTRASARRSGSLIRRAADRVRTRSLAAEGLIVLSESDIRTYRREGWFADVGGDRWNRGEQVARLSGFPSVLHGPVAGRNRRNSTALPERSSVC